MTEKKTPDDIFFLKPFMPGYEIFAIYDKIFFFF